jgi:hypothetical protein
MADEIATSGLGRPVTLHEGATVIAWLRTSSRSRQIKWIVVKVSGDRSLT